MTAPSELLEVLRMVTTRLKEAGFAYMLTGSMAMNFYGEARMTHDIDLVIRMRATDVEWILALFSRDFDVDEAAVARAIVTDRVFNLVHRDTRVRVRCVVLKDAPHPHEEFERRREALIGDIPAMIVSPEDLILSKLVGAPETGSTFHMEDVRELLRTRTDLDAQYLDQWAPQLGVADRLEQARH
jgi:hypothetical protein